MNIDSLLNRIHEAFRSIFNIFNTGNPVTDVLVFIAVIAAAIIVSGLIVYFFTTQVKDSNAQLERLEGMLGRLERVERTLNEFRTDALRHLELSRSHLEYIRAAQEHQYDMLKGDSSESADSAVKPRVPKTEFDPFAPRTPVTPEPPPVAAPIAAEPTPPVIEKVEPAPETLAKRLKKTRSGFLQKIRSVFSSKSKFDTESVDELEALLVGSDIGIKTAAALLVDLKEDLRFGVEVSELGLTALLKANLIKILEQGAPSTLIAVPRRGPDGPVIVLMVGVNGAGKTTTAAKLAHQWKDAGCKVLLVAADTFRAAAVDQLHEWGKRLDIPVVSGAPDAKPQTVIFDAMTRAAQEPFDAVIIDTAGRLHTKQSLMDELTGIYNAIRRHQASAPEEVLLVVDGSTGQNALAQAREFSSAAKLTGIVVTKLDGTSKGGIIVAIKDELNIPVRYIGVGEGKNDLRPFVPRDFVEAIFDIEGDGAGGGAEVSANAEIRRRRRAEG